MITVHSSCCRALPDGRRKHIYTKVEDQFVCTQCGAVSDPGRRWEQPLREAL